MITNILAQVILSLVTNITNVVFEMPSGTEPIWAAHPPSIPRPALQRTVVTNVYERIAITWTLHGRTNTCVSDRLIYSASQVMKLKEEWEPGTLTIHNTP